MLCDTILYYTILYYTILYYTILYYTMIYYTILYYTILYYTILYYTILYYTTIRLLCYTILYYTIIYYTLLHYFDRRMAAEEVDLIVQVVNTGVFSLPFWGSDFFPDPKLKEPITLIINTSYKHTNNNTYNRAGPRPTD